MTVKSMKISGWDVHPAQPKDGEEHACVVSFRISNIIGADCFVALFKEAKKGIEDRENFNSISLIGALSQFALAIYKSLKQAKRLKDH